MAITDAHGFALAVDIHSASPHETKLVTSTLEARFVADPPERLIGDKAYDSDPLDAELAELGVELIAPHRRNRKKVKLRMVASCVVTSVGGRSNASSAGFRALGGCLCVMNITLLTSLPLSNSPASLFC